MNFLQSLCIKLAVTVLAGATLPLAALTPISAAPVASGTCATTATKYKVSKTLHQTASTSYVNVIDTNLAFVQGGGSASCAIVLFSSEASGVANERMQVRVLLDNLIVCQPDNSLFANNTTDYVDRTMSFVCADVAPGSHTIRMQFQSVTGGTVALGFRTTLVHYVK
jgi:hypothetical protein